MRLGIFASFCVSLLFCFGSFSAAPTLRLALNWKAEPQFGGFYEAERLGLFKNLSPPLQILQGGSGTPTLQMLLSGQTEYAVVSADEIIIAAGRGNNQIVALFASFQDNPQGLMLRANHPAMSLQQALQSADSILLWQDGLPYAQYLRKKWGAPKAKTAPYAGGIANFVSESKVIQQCFVTSEPLLAKKQKLDVKTFLIKESGYNPYTTVLATTRERLKTHPDEVKAMVLAVREGWSAYLKNPEPSHSLIQKLNPAMDALSLKEGAFAQKGLIQTPKGVALGAMDASRWQQLTDQLMEIGAIKTKIAAAELFQNF